MPERKDLTGATFFECGDLNVEGVANPEKVQSVQIEASVKKVRSIDTSLADCLRVSVAEFNAQMDFLNEHLDDPSEKWIFENEDFSGCDLTGVDLSAFEFHDCRFHQTIVMDAQFPDEMDDKTLIDLLRCGYGNFGNYTFHDLDFSDVDFTRCEIAEVKFVDCDMNGAKITYEQLLDNILDVSDSYGTILVVLTPDEDE